MNNLIRRLSQRFAAFGETTAINNHHGRLTSMLIHIDNDTAIDTDRDLSSEERHVLQKLLCYKTYVASLEEFREKKELAYSVGWNNSGPITESKALRRVVLQMEKEVTVRLENENTNTT